MPADMSKYPKEWPEIRRKILLRAGGNEDDPRIGARCEKCGVRNYAVGYRQPDGSFYCTRGNIYRDAFQYATSYEEARALAENDNEWSDGKKYIVIVLTIAHLHDEDPQNVNENNLAALCQRCHNRHDMTMRRKHAMQTRAAKAIQQGQTVMPWALANKGLLSDLKSAGRISLC